MARNGGLLASATCHIFCSVLCTVPMFASLLMDTINTRLYGATYTDTDRHCILMANRVCSPFCRSDHSLLVLAHSALCGQSPVITYFIEHCPNRSSHASHEWKAQGTLRLVLVLTGHFGGDLDFELEILMNCSITIRPV